MNKFLGFILIAMLSVSLVACGGQEWSGDYKVTEERLDDSGAMYVTVKADGIKDEESLKSFISKFKSDNPTYNSHDSLFVSVDDGGTQSKYKVANSAKGAKQTGLEEHTEEFEYKD